MLAAYGYRAEPRAGFDALLTKTLNVSAMAIDRSLALESVLASGDEWQSWRALHLSDEAAGDPPRSPAQDDEGGFLGDRGVPSPGATGEAVCHLAILGLSDSGSATVAADWLEEVRTPAQAWLDSPDDVPGELDDPAGGRVWATAAAACALLVVGRDPGPRAVQLLRGEAMQDGSFNGGAYPTFAAAALFWQVDGEKSEMSEWALRWAREAAEGTWGPWEYASALTFWAAAGIPAENATVETFLDTLLALGSAEGWQEDLGLTLRALELQAHLES